MRKMPPLNALRAFEAAGRHLNLMRAADELCVTHGAISKQVKLLEESLDVKLAIRTHRGLNLTSEGQALQEQLSIAFDGIAGAVRNVKRGEIRGAVHVVCMPAFATHWLIPNIASFYARYKDISMTIAPPDGDDPFRDPKVDIAILFGRPQWPNKKAQLLKQMEFFPVCSPVLLSGPKKIRRSSDLKRHVLLDDPEETHWQDWFALVGSENPRNIQRMHFSDFNHTIAAARAGLGVAMGDNVTLAADLLSGSLVRPLEGVLSPESKAYYIITPTEDGLSGPAQVFIDWLTMQSLINDLPFSASKTIR